jgi:cysteine synthase A
MRVQAGSSVVAKLRIINPVGCVKERIALAMVEMPEAKGILKPGATLSTLPV